VPADLSADLPAGLPFDLLAARDVYPPVDYSPWWWLVVAGCVLGIVAVGWWARRSLRGLRPPATPRDALEALRGETLARLAALEASYAAGDLGPADAHQRLGAEVRRFAGTATNGDADYRVLPELRLAAVKEPRLEPVVWLLAVLEAAAFEPAGTTSPPSPPVFARAREVVEQWE
jgi:hypothetical protein